MLPARLERV